LPVTNMTSVHTNRQFVLNQRPKGLPDPDQTFKLVTAPLPKPADGQVVVRSLEFSLDPAMRGWIADQGTTYRDAVKIGSVMEGSVTGIVVESKTSQIPKGDRVIGSWGWQEYALVNEKDVRKIPDDVPSQVFLGAAGGTGLTAYFGLFDVCQPDPGETVLVSGAAGATGSIVGQLAKIKGCYVVGIAGSEEKCAWLRSIGFDQAINYKNKTYSQLLAAVKEACPKGIDVYFDNVGGEQLEIAISLINVNARIACCGSISNYNNETPAPGPRNLFMLVVRRARMQGFLVTDYAKKFAQARAQLIEWIKQGKIVHRDTIVEGFESLPKAFLKLFDGSNTGKLLVRARL